MNISSGFPLLCKIATPGGKASRESAAMSKSLAHSKILKRVSKRKKADSTYGCLEYLGGGKFSLKALPAKRSVLKLTADASRGLIKRRSSHQSDKTSRGKGNRVLEKLDDSY